MTGEAGAVYGYGSGNLTSITRTDGSGNAGQAYSFTHDSFGSMLTVSAGDRELASYTYAQGNGLLTSMGYGNGADVEYTYDELGRIRTASYSDGTELTCHYTGDGQLGRTVERKGEEEREYEYTYDSIGRLMASRLVDGDAGIRASQTYNSSNRLKAQSWQAGEGDSASSYSESYTYNSYDGQFRTSSVKSGGTEIASSNVTYDSLRRLNSINTGTYLKSYDYKDLGTDRTTGLVGELAYTGLDEGLTWLNDYGYRGDIVSIQDPLAGTREYTYDILGRLTAESVTKDGSTAEYSYTYDSGGNILTAQGPEGSHTYTYGDAGWKDLLTAYDGQAITYDAIGNPLSYYNGTRWTFGWQNGRQLASASSGSTTVSYEYSQADGMRTGKTVGTTEYRYYYAGGKLLRMEKGSDTVMDFFYDHQGSPFAVMYNGTLYYFILNLQGDVVRIVDEDGAAAATYIYDAWGDILSSTAGAEGSVHEDNPLVNENPLRYRGYVYDEETGFYYVSSRYYDPGVGRFISADTTDVLGVSSDLYDKNLYAYCDNNPIVRRDTTGFFWETALDVISLGGSIVEVTMNPTDLLAWAGLVGDVVDLTPFLTGLGEAVDIYRHTIKAGDKIDNVIDAAKGMNLPKSVKKTVGSYEIEFASGNKYVGKGKFKRAIKSAEKKANDYNDTVTSIRFKTSRSDKDAFIDEYYMQKRNRGMMRDGFRVYNKNWSPGKRYSGFQKY